MNGNSEAADLHARGSPRTPTPILAYLHPMSPLHLLPTAWLWLMCAAFTAAESPIRPGDHIAIVGNTFADQLRIHGYLETHLMQHTLEDPVSIRNLGWGGDTLAARDRPTGFPTEEATLRAHKTDVIIACFGMGESFNGQPGLAEFERQLLTFIETHAGKSYNGHSAVRLVLVSPIACEDLAELTPNREQRNENLQAYQRVMSEVASTMDIPFVDLFSSSRYLMDEPLGPHLTTNGIHLNAYGYWAVSKSFGDQLISSDAATAPRPWRLALDAAAKTSENRGVKVFDISAEGPHLSFYVRELSPPSLAPPTPAKLPPQLERIRDTLVIENLKPGNYRLTVDGATVVTADAEAWGEGVAIDSSPAHLALEAYRLAVNDKNLQFTYGWKALNQVHIVGERKQSPSGRELPKEILQFKQLAEQREAALRSGVEWKTRHWRVTRVESDQ